MIKVTETIAEWHSDTEIPPSHLLANATDDTINKNFVTGTHINTL